MCVRWVWTVRGEMNSRAAISLLAKPSLTSRATSSSVGVSEAQPLDGRLRQAATALGVGDCLISRQRGALGPCAARSAFSPKYSRIRATNERHIRRHESLNLTMPSSRRMVSAAASSRARLRMAFG